MQYDIKKYIELEDKFKLEHNNINEIPNIITNNKESDATIRFCNKAIKSGKSNWSIILPI